MLFLSSAEIFLVMLGRFPKNETVLNIEDKVIEPVFKGKPCSCNFIGIKHGFLCINIC